MPDPSPAAPQGTVQGVTSAFHLASWNRAWAGAGATGSGKSVGLNTILACLLFRNTPDRLRLILVDPKRVELSRWGKAPHLLAGVITDPNEVVGALRWLVAEMERRYALLESVGARDLKGYNRALRPGTPPEPVIVTVIDELADLILQLGPVVEPELVRIAQKARAVGLHLVVATQRPSTDVLTGTIKANFPARIAFTVASATDSRVILDAPGAEALLGRGDMLFQAPDAPKPVRIQGAFIGDAELERLMAFWAGAGWPGPGRLPPWLDLIPGEDPDEDLYQQGLVEQDDDKRKAIFNKMEDLMEDSGCFIFICFEPFLAIHDDNLNPVILADLILLGVLWWAWSQIPRWFREAIYLLLKRKRDGDGGRRR